MTVLDTRFYNLGSFCLHSENIRFSGLEFTFLLTGLCMQLTEKTKRQGQDERIKLYISTRITFLVLILVRQAAHCRRYKRYMTSG